MSELMVSLPDLPNNGQYFFKRPPSGGWEVHRPDGSGNIQKIDPGVTFQTLPARATSDRQVLNKKDRAAYVAQKEIEAEKIVKDYQARKAGLNAVTYGFAQAKAVNDELTKTADNNRTINERNKRAYGIK